MVITSGLYLLKNSKYQKEFPLIFEDYLTADLIDSQITDVKYVLAWSQVLNQLHHYCIMIYNIPPDLDKFFDLNAKHSKYHFKVPREITIKSNLTEEGYRRIAKYLVADDCLAYLELVIYQKFPVADRNWFVEHFKYHHEEIIKNVDHFKTLNDDEYIIKLRTELEN